jgi:hypothetical protein
VCLTGSGAATAGAVAGNSGSSSFATPPASCDAAAFSYAGEYSQVAAPGIEADVSATTSADVPYGHVAGWIGVGGTKAGPNGEQDWIQAGLDTVAGAGSELYAEIAQPGQEIRHVTLASNVAPGTSYRLAVVRLANRPNVWQVTLDGAPATAPIYLPRSASFRPMAMGESWNGGQEACNGFSYRFAGLRIATAAGSWTPLTNPGTLENKGFQITDRTAAGFTAGTG